MQASRGRESALLEDRVVACIHEVIDEYNTDLPPGMKLAKTSNTPLYGPDGQLDSLALVHLIIAVEQKVEATLGLALTLADERAMSEQHSPFASVGSLTAYVQALVDAETRALG